MLEIRNLNVNYGEKTVFGNFSLEVKDREILCVMGRSGCGKTTLLNAVAGLVPYTGSITGADGVSYMFQEDRLIPSLTALGNVTFAVAHMYKDKKEAEEKALAALEAVGLKGYEKRYPHTLSGGQAARVSLARAFCYPSGLLIADEPFKGLDIATADALENYFLSLFDGSEKCAVIVSHSVEEAVRLSDRVIVLGGSPCAISYETEINKLEDGSKDPVYCAHKAAEIKAAIIASGAYESAQSEI